MNTKKCEACGINPPHPGGERLCLDCFVKAFATLLRQPGTTMCPLCRIRTAEPHGHCDPCLADIRNRTTGIQHKARPVMCPLCRTRVSEPHGHCGTCLAAIRGQVNDHYTAAGQRDTAAHRARYREWYKEQAATRRTQQTTLTCKECEQELPAEDFKHSNRTDTGYGRTCKACITLSALTAMVDRKAAAAAKPPPQRRTPPGRPPATFAEAVNQRAAAYTDSHGARILIERRFRAKWHHRQGIKADAELKAAYGTGAARKEELEAAKSEAALKAIQQMETDAARRELWRSKHKAIQNICLEQLPTLVAKAKEVETEEAQGFRRRWNYITTLTYDQYRELAINIAELNGFTEGGLTCFYCKRSMSWNAFPPDANSPCGFREICYRCIPHYNHRHLRRKKAQ